jgi:hypothetical protein
MRRVAVSRTEPVPPVPTDRSDDVARDLAVLYAYLADRIARRRTTYDALSAVTDVAISVVPGVHHASITRQRDEGFQTLAPTSAVATGADKLQYELGSGPCVDSVRIDGPLLSTNLATDLRWPAYGPQVAAEFGIGSMLSMHMVLDEDIHASLNLYSEGLDSFSPRSETMATVLTTHGALAVSGVIARERAEHLENALTNSRRIGTAVGILMFARKLTADQAFAVMRVVSQNSNRRMILIAEEVIETGTLHLPA